MLTMNNFIKKLICDKNNLFQICELVNKYKFHMILFMFMIRLRKCMYKYIIKTLNYV